MRPTVYCSPNIPKPTARIFITLVCISTTPTCYPSEYSKRSHRAWARSVPGVGVPPIVGERPTTRSARGTASGARALGVPGARLAGLRPATMLRPDIVARQGKARQGKAPAVLERPCYVWYSSRRRWDSGHAKPPSLTTRPKTTRHEHTLCVFLKNREPPGTTGDRIACGDW